MTPLDASIVRRKLRKIRSNLDTLGRATNGVDLAAYTENEILRRAVERLLQETVDAAVDINNHLIRSADRPAAEDYHGSFTALAHAGVLDARAAAALAPAAGLRNRIVHEYEELDDSQVLRAAQEAPASLREYIAAVEAYLTRQNL